MVNEPNDDVLEEMRKLLAGIPSAYGAADEVRANRQTNAPDGSVLQLPAISGPLTETDRILDEGSEAERRELAITVSSAPDYVYSPDPPSLYESLAAAYGGSPNIDARLEELAGEIPKVETGGNLFTQGFGAIVDVGGNFIGAALNTLDMPAELVERSIGMAYFNEIDSWGDRWAMAALTYDVIASGGLGSNGDRDELLIDYWQNEINFDEIIEKYNNTWGNAIGHIMLDPLWFIGGVPLVTKIPGIGGTAAARVVNRGIDFSRIPIVRKIPVVRGIGSRPVDRVVDESKRALEGTGKSFPEVKASGGWREATELSAGAKASERSSHFIQVFASMSDPRLWADNGAVIREMLRELRAGERATKTDIFPPRIFNDADPIRGMREIMSENPGTFNFDTYQALQPINTGDVFWRGAKEALGEDVIQRAAAGGTLTIKEGQAYARYRTAMLLDETFARTVPDIGKLFDVKAGLKAKRADDGSVITGGFAQGTPFERADLLSAGMKRWLSMVILNTPRFVGLNYLNNAFHLMAKGESPIQALRFLGNPFHGLSSSQLRKLEVGGVGEEILSRVALDPSYWREITGRSSINGLRESRLRFILPGLHFSQKMDQGARQASAFKGAEGVGYSVWQFESAGGALKDLPPELEHLRDGLVALARTDAAGVEAWVRAVREGGARPTAATLRVGWSNNLASEPAQAGLHASAIPESLVDDIDDILQAGSIDDIYRLLDDAADEIDLAVYMARAADNLPDVPLPTTALRGNYPWQQQAQFHTTEIRMENFWSRLFTSGGATTVQLRRIQTNQRNYMRTVETILTDARRIAGTAQDTADVPKRIIDAMDAALEQRNTVFREVFDQSNTAGLGRNLDQTVMQQLIDDAGFNLDISGRLRRPSGQFSNLLDMLLRGERDRILSLGLARNQAMGTDEFANIFRQTMVEENQSVERMFSAMNMEMPAGGRVDFAVRPEYPTGGAAMTTAGASAQDFIGYVRRNLPDANKTDMLSDEQLRLFDEYVNGTEAVGSVRPGGTAPAVQGPAEALVQGPLEQADAAWPGLAQTVAQRQLAENIVGQGMANWTMLQYSRKYGIDGALSLIYPYAFWPTRTLRDWMRMTLARPGATAAYTGLYDMVADVNADANLPARVKRSIRIPVPFIDDVGLSSLVTGDATNRGAGGAIMVDPIRILYPLSTFQGERFGSEDLTMAGRALQWSEQVPGTSNPFITGPLGGLGVLGDRTTYLRRSLNIPSIPPGLPGPRVISAIYDWFTGVSEDPDPSVLTPEMKEQLVNGEPLDEGILKRALRPVWELASSDGFDEYRLNRMIANMVGEDPQQWTPRAAMEALDTKSGPLYTEAKRRAQGDRGLSLLTGWLVMPVRVYPEGEQIQRGLDAMYRNVKATGDPQAIEAFFALHPEFSVRRLATGNLDDPAAQSRELDTSLFFLDLAEVERKFDPEIDSLRETIREAESRRMLESNEGRKILTILQGELNYLSELKQEEVDILRGLYPDMAIEKSLKSSPRERALFELRGDYLDISRDDFRTNEEFFTARDTFINDLQAEPTRMQDWNQLAVQSVAIHAVYTDRAAQQDGDRDALIAERDERLRGLTQTARGQVSRQDFQAFLKQGQSPPTPARLEYEQAFREITEYRAIDEAPGLTPSAKKTLKRNYWANHPLLSKYYSNTEPIDSTRDAVAYGRMDQIWIGYFAVEGNARKRRDYLGINLLELNFYRDQVGLPAIRLVGDPVQPRQFQQEPTDPHERALQDAAYSE